MENWHKGTIAAGVIALAIWGVAVGTQKPAPPEDGPWNDYAPRPAQEQARPEPVIDRGALGGCASGYVDHPTNPKQCVLPAVAERYYARLRRER